jgi:hypothetical protein
VTEPALTALFFADQIIVEQGTQKKSAIGIFDRFFAPQFPVSFPPWSIFAGVTNLEGDHNFALNLVSEQDEVVVALSGGFHADNPASNVDIVPRIGQAIFPRAGDYHLTFHIDGLIIAQRLLHVQSLPAAASPGLQMFPGMLPKGTQ